MPLKVGELYATLKLDDRDFGQGMDRAKGRWDGLGSALKKGGETAARLFAGTTTAVVGLGAAALKVGLDYNRMQQSSRAALTQLLGSAEAANAQMDKLDEFAKTSPFAKQVFIQAQQQMLGFGVATEDVLPALDAIQNAVAAFGGSSEDIASITDVLSRLQSQGRLSGEALERLGYYGIDAAKIIGEKMGKSGAEIKKMASKPGGIPVEEIWDPLVTGLMDRFGGATALIKDQMDGAIDRVKAAWRDIGGIMAEPLIDPKGGGLAVEWVNALADAMRAAEGKVGPLVDILVKRFNPALSAVTPLLERVEGAINSWDLRNVNSQLDELGKYAPLIAGTSAALFAMGTANLPILSQLGFTGINPVVAGLAALVAASPAARSALGDVWSAMSPLADIAKDLGLQLADTLMHALDVLTPALGDLAVSAVEAGIPLAQSLTPAVVALLEAGLPLVDVVAKVVDWMAQLPGPVLATAAAMVAFGGPLTGVVRTLTSGGAKVFDTLRQNAYAASIQLEGAGVMTSRMNIAAATAKSSVGKLGTALKTAFIANGVTLAIGALTAAFAAFAQKQAEARQRTEEYKQTLDDVGDRTAATVERINAALSEDRNNWIDNIFGKDPDSLIDKGERLGLAVDDLQGYILGEEDAVDRVNRALEEYATQSAGSISERNRNEYAANSFRAALDSESESLTEAERAALQKAEADKAAGIEAEDAARKTDDHTRALRDQYDALNESANASISQSRALRNQEDAQKRTKDALAELNDLTKSGKASEEELEAARRKVKSALDDEAQANLDVVAALDRNNASAEDVRAATEKARESFIKAAEQMGLTKKEAEALADSYGLIPRNIITDIKAEAADAQRTINKFITDNNGRVINIRVNASGDTSYGMGRNAGRLGGPMRYEADGSIAVASYASGKMPSQAIIKAAQPGLVQWAEPSTHGEAFIPLAPSKRARSLAIWEETGRRLGVIAETFADGAVRAPSGSAATQLPTSQRPINIVINGVPVDHVNETAKALNFALRSRGGVYAFGTGAR